jgi:hypothetical protein
MDIKGFHVVFILIFYTLVQHVYMEKCLLNYCQCETTTITCDIAGGPRPIFTQSEKRHVRLIFLSVDQTKWFETACKSFPSMDLAYFGKLTPLPEGVTCPQIANCPEVKTRCL